MMSPGLRKSALIVHVACSIGWLGALAAYLALDLAAVLGQNAETVRAAQLAMGLIVSYVIVPLALAALVTGIVQALGTSWGLIRHYWVVAKLLLSALATAVLLVTAPTVASLAERAGAPADSAMMTGTLSHSIGGLIVLLVILILSVVKPRGLTRYGWRRQRDQRRKKTMVAAERP